MTMLKRFTNTVGLFSPFLLAALLGCDEGSSGSVSLKLPTPHIDVELANSLQSPLDETNGPIIAVWRAFPGFSYDTNYPNLRVAVWGDGRVVFSRDPEEYNQDLMLSQISPETLTKLKQEITLARAFDVTNRVLIHVDRGWSYLTLAFDGRYQLLQWDELKQGESPQYQALTNAWWNVNRLALSAIPNRATKLKDHFTDARLSWYPPEVWFQKEKIDTNQMGWDFRQR